MGLNAESPVHNVWKTDLYRMQLEAPSPIPILCARLPQNRPDYLGADYHGEISNKQASELLDQENDGAYLVRSSPSSYGQFYTLSLKFNSKIHHYKLFYDPVKTGLYVREKRYDCVRSLVADGLVTMYLELRAPLLIQHLSTINYNESPYMTLNKRKLRALSREPSRNKRCMTQTKALSSAVLPVESVETIERYEKAHVFKVTTFKGLNWCELCGNFLWGFTAQGVRCEDCGFMAHGKCSERVPNDCIPDIKYIRGVFGIDLTTLLTAHSASIPFVVIMCAKEVEVRGLTTEGIYRLSGFADEIEALKMAFDTDGEKADLSETAYNNINVVAGALKLYLRLLPIPLITFQVHPILMKAIQTKNINEQIKNIAQVLTKLPTAHIKTFQYMMEHLNRVSLHHAINKMNARNLATVFAPTLIGRSTDPTMGPPDLSSDIYLLELIILHCDKIFQKPLDI